MTPTVIDRFMGEYRFLSNFHPAVVSFEGQVYPTVENAYQAAKTANRDERAKIALASPGEAKRMGRRCVLRPGWAAIRLAVMEDLVRKKFENSAALQNRLCATGAATLIEGNDWGDTFWGVYRGHGENHLGKILMQVRRELFEAHRA